MLSEKERELAITAEFLRQQLARIQAVVTEQAEDEGLWSVPAVGTQPTAEAYLQQELRHLHAVIESNAEGEHMPLKPSPRTERRGRRETK